MHFLNAVSFLFRFNDYRVDSVYTCRVPKEREDLRNTGMLISSHSVQLTAYTLQPHTHTHAQPHAHTAVSCSLSKRASQQFINVLINIHAEGGEGREEGGEGTTGAAALKTNTRGSRT